MGTVLTLQFWMFAAELFTVAQGKRLFGPIAAGGVVGATAGASLAAALMRVSPVGTLLVVAAGIFLAAAATLAGVSAEDQRGAPGATAGALGWVKDLGIVRRDPYVKRLATMTALGTAAVLVVDYLFKSVAAREVPAAELGSFFATYYAAQNGVSLIVQVFVAGLVVRRFGVASAVLALPILLVVAGAGAVVAGRNLAVALAGKAADGALRHSLHRVSSELLFLPMPGDVRDRAKPVIDTVFGRGIQAATAAGILALTSLGWASDRLLGGLVLVLSAGWLGAALLVRKPYVDLFRKALSLGEIESVGRGDLDLPSVEALMESLSSREEDRVLAALDLIVDSGRTRLVPGLILYHDSPKVLERALSVVQAAGRKDWAPLAERLLGHADPAVRAAAVRALAAAGVTAAVEKGLDDPSDAVRAYAAFFLVQGRGEDAEPLGDRRIISILDAPGDDGVRGRSALLGVIGEHGDARWTDVVAEALARDRKKGLDATTAAAAIQRVGDPSFVPHLLGRLASREGRSAVREALVSLGKPAFDALEKALADPLLDSRIRIHLPRTISRFGTQEAVDLLTRRLAEEANGAVRFKILRGLGRLATDSSTTKQGLKFDRAAFEKEAHRNLLEHLRLLGLLQALDAPLDGEALPETSGGSVLHGLLDDKIRQSLERAFRCLNIAHRHENIHGVYTALQSSDKRARANALEFLDALSLKVQGLRELLRVVVDDLPVAERVRRSAPLVKQPPPDGPIEAIRRLLRDGDVLVAALAGFHALDLGLLALRGDVQQVFEERPELHELGRRQSAPPPPPPA
jgi:AAA family ATP:ADP antiporter